MRFSCFALFALPLLSSAQEAQVPLSNKAQSWLDKAKSYIPTAANPVNAAASAIADLKIQRINQRNFDRILRAPRPDGEEEWLIYVTGGNKTCFGRCEPVDEAWNRSVPLLSALPSSSNKPSLHLGMIDCEQESVLCSGWGANCPSIYHFTFPASSSPVDHAPLRIRELNVTTTTISDMTALSLNAPQSTILSVPVYEGAFHPISGWLAKTQTQIPLGYVIYFMSTTPSWMIMIGISFFSRQYMSRRTLARTSGAPQVPAQGAGVPPAGMGSAGTGAKTPAKGAAPAGGLKSGGSGKKRK